MLHGSRPTNLLVTLTENQTLTGKRFNYRLLAVIVLDQSLGSYIIEATVCPLVFQACRRFALNPTVSVLSVDLRHL